jgi:hypothetical protein
MHDGNPHGQIPRLQRPEAAEAAICSPLFENGSATCILLMRMRSANGLSRAQPLGLGSMFRACSNESRTCANCSWYVGTRAAAASRLVRSFCSFSLSGGDQFAEFERGAFRDLDTIILVLRDEILVFDKGPDEAAGNAQPQIEIGTAQMLIQLVHLPALDNGTPVSSFSW